MPYCEVQPPASLRQQVECFWLSSNAEDLSHRVTPDGCSDILYVRTPRGSTLQFVSAMTRFEDFCLAGGTSALGVRFRPGMAAAIAPDLPADSIAPLDQIWGKQAAQLLRRLDAADSDTTWMALLAGGIPAAAKSPVQQAVQELAASRGVAPLSTLAAQCGLSERHFRRVCFQLTGLSPKLLARILRFRHARELLHSPYGLADVAQRCGYSDQSHMIADCREFSGHSPKQIRACFRP